MKKFNLVSIPFKPGLPVGRAEVASRVRLCQILFQSRLSRAFQSDDWKTGDLNALVKKFQSRLSRAFQSDDTMQQVRVRTTIKFQSRLSRAFQSDTDRDLAFAAAPLELSGLATVTYWPASRLFDLMILSQTSPIFNPENAELRPSEMLNAATGVVRGNDFVAEYRSTSEWSPIFDKSPIAWPFSTKRHSHILIRNSTEGTLWIVKIRPTKKEREPAFLTAVGLAKPREERAPSLQ